jgi:hypothetical protein
MDWYASLPGEQLQHETPQPTGRKSGVDETTKKTPAGSLPVAQSRSVFGAKYERPDVVALDCLVTNSGVDQLQPNYARGAESGD